MSRRVQVTFDAADPHQLAFWWADLLRYQVEDHHDRVASLLADGVLAESDVSRVDGRLRFADLAAARDPADVGPRLFFQRVPEPKTAKNRMHLDVPVEPGQLDSEVDRLRAAGAILVGFNSYPGHRSAVMRDPEGNEFCLQ
jgi:catechol 2,3-dioxygenase-like lactoylglutathione lyase family enzyme